MRQIPIRQFQQSFDLDKIRQVAGNPDLRENQVFDFPTFLIARSGKNKNKTEITSDGQKAAVALWLGKSILLKAHKVETENQIGRIYDAWIEERDGETLTYGRAYDIKATDPAGQDLQARIANRVHREMSAGYQPVKSVCNICGADTLNGHCPEHVNDPEYCRRDLEFIPDHVSFCADPAIDGAGLVLNTRQDEPDPAPHRTEDPELTKLADDGRVFREWVSGEFGKWYRLNNRNANTAEIRTLTDKLSAREMMTFARIERDQFQQVIPDGAQQLQAPEETKSEPVAPTFTNVQDIFKNRR